MNTPTSPACRNCLFWEKSPFGGGVLGSGTDGSVSNCRRHAPEPMTDGYTPTRARRFPQTEARDWCGEHRPVPSMKPPHKLVAWLARSPTRRERDRWAID